VLEHAVEDFVFGNAVDQVMLAQEPFARESEFLQNPA
jgi:hypothetical protein